MKTIRRPISILLAVLLVVGMFTIMPISVGAESNVALLDGEAEYTTVSAAFAAITDNQPHTVKLLADSTSTSNIGVYQGSWSNRTGGKNVTLDLNGFTYTQNKTNGTGAFVLAPSSDFTEGSSLIVKDSSSAKTGKITSNSQYTTIQCGSMCTFELQSGTIDNTNQDGYGTALQVSGSGVSTLKGGTAVSNGTAVYMYPASGNNHPVLNVKGSTVSGSDYAIYTDNDYDADYNVTQYGACEVNITSGTINGDYGIIQYDKGTVNVSGGTFNSTYPFYSDNVEGSEFNVTGGTYAYPENAEYYFDEDYDDAIAIKYTNANGAVSYLTELPSAFSDGTYQLLKNITRTSRMVPGTFAYDVTLDLNGYILNSTATDAAIQLNRTGSSDEQRYFALVDTSTNGGGKLVANSLQNSGSSNTASVITSSGKYNDITIDNVTIEATQGIALLGENQTLTIDKSNITITGDDYALATNGKFTNGAEIEVTDSSITSTQGIGVYLPGVADATFTDTNVTGTTAMYIKGGDVTIDGGSYTATGTAAEYSYNGNGANPTGDAIVVENAGSAYPSNDVTITGDVTFASANNKALALYTKEESASVDVTLDDVTVPSAYGVENAKFIFENGAAITDIDIPEDCKLVDNGDGTSTVAPKDYVAQVGTAKFETLAAAIAAAQNGNTVKLLSDVTEAVTISGKTLTLDLNGNNITSPSSVQPIKALNAAELTITNSNDAKSENTPTQNAILGRDANGYGSLLARDGATVDIKAGYYYGYTGNKTAIHAYNGATVTFYDCVVNGAEAIEGDPTTGKEGKVFYSGLENPMNPTGSYPGTIIVHGGTFNGRMSDSNWGNYVIDGGTFDRNEVVINENPVDENGNPKATTSGSMTKIKDGTLDEAGWLADGFTTVDNGDGTYGVEKTKAVEAYDANGDLVGAYTTIDAAIEAGGDECTVKLVADLYEQQQINSQKTPVTLDLNGHMINVQNGAGLNFSMGYYWNGDHIFTIKDTSEEKTGGINITPKYFGNACISDNTGRTIIVEGGTFTSTGKAIYCTGSDDGITVNGGTFYGDIYVHDTGYGHGTLSITGGTVNGTLSTKDNAVLTVSGGTFSEPVPAEYCAEGYDPVANDDGTYTVAPHEHDWDYENVSWTFTENASHIIYAKYTLTCKTDPTHTKEQTGSGTMMLTVAVDGDKFVYSHSAVKIDGNSVAVPNYTRNIADGIINQYELKAAVKVAGNYKLANDITGFTDNVNPVDGFVLDGQNHMIKYGTINAGNRVMFVAADQNTKFTLKNITLDGNNKAKWAVCAYTGNSGNNAGNVITLDTVTIQNFKSNDYVGAINAFGSSTWNLKDCTITGNTTVDDSDGLSGSAVWAGSKATINIDGGTYDEVYLHSYSGTGAVLNADGGATIDNLVLDLTKTDTLKANIDEATVGAITSNEGTIPEEAVVMDPAKATVAAPEGYKWVDSDETGMKTLAQIVYVAQIGETKYETLADAIAAAQTGDTITVIADTTVPCGTTQITGKSITIDATGYTVTGEGYTTFPMFSVKSTGGLTLTGGTFTNPGGIISNSGTAEVDGATLTAGGFAIQNKGDLTITSGTITATEAAITNGATTAETTITGGTFTGKIKMSNDGDGTFAISGGTFDRPVPADFCAEGYVPKANDDGTYTVEVKPADLFVGYGLTLHGDIGLIFYLDPTAVGVDAANVSSVSVSFTCDKYTGTVTDFTREGDRIKVAYYVPAAYMASPVHAYSVTINGVTSNEIDDCSVQDYALRVIDTPSLISDDETTQNNAVKLMKEMLNYGAKAKAVFQSQMSAPEAAVYKTIPNYTMATVDADMIDAAIKGEATDMSTVHPEADANFYAPSVIYLSKTTLRMVFLIPTGNGSTCPEEYSGKQAPWYYWKDVTDIPAAELDEQQDFEINGATFHYSVLDYAKAVVAGGSSAQKDLAASLYLYNQAANAFFAD